MKSQHYLLATGLLALSLCLAGPVQANPEAMGQRGLKDSFADMDYNRDGKVDRDEFLKAHPNLKPEAFNAIDVNNDMVITREEWDAFARGHKKELTMPGMGTDKGAHKAMPPKHGAPGIMPPKGGKPVPPPAGK